MLNLQVALGAPAPKVLEDPNGGWTWSQHQDCRILMEKCMRVWVSEPRAHYGLSINTLRVNVGWARLALAWVPCAGPVSWWRYHLMAVDQAFIGGFE